MGSLLEDYKKSKQGGLLDEFKQPKQPEMNEPYTRTPSALEQSIAGSEPKMVTDRPVPTGSPQTERIPVANAGPYTSGDEFQSLLQQAKQVGVDNLPEPQKSQVKAAIQGGVVREADLMGTQADPKVQDALSAVGEVAQGFVQSGDPEEVQKYAPGLLESLDQAFSKAMQMPGGEAAGQAMEEMFSTKLAMNGFNLMPDTIPKDNSLAEIGRASENLVKGAVRLLPELLVGLYQNPHEFVKGLVTFPVHEVNLLLQASIGWKLGEGRPVEVTADQVKKARQELVNNPLGVVMLGMMGLHGAKGKSEFTTVELKQFEALVEQAKAGEKLKKAEEKPPVTMGAEDVGKTVPEVKPEITPEAAAKAIPEGDVRYDALVDYGENLGKRHQFTLMVEGQESTFNVKDLAELPEKAAKKRTEMAEGAKWRAERDAKLAAEAKAAAEAQATPPVTKGGGNVDFPESKVTETVYHGSPADNITEFFTEQGKTGGNTGATNTALGAYFSESPEIATTAAFGFSPLGAFSGKPLTLYDIKLNLRKPLDLDAITTSQIGELEKSFPGFGDAYKKASSEGEKMSLLRFFAKARDKGPVRENFATFGRRAGLTDDMIEQQFKDRAGKEFSEWDAIQQQARDASINSVGKKRLKELGYDGIVLNTISDSGDKLGPKKQYVVFDKENIAITNKRSILDMADESPTPSSVKTPVGKELVKPEPVETGFKEADIARNLGHTRGFIKSLEERIKEGDKNPETVKTWKRQLREAKAEEADLMKQVEDVQADNLLGAGLSPDQITAGITNRAMREAERRRAASRSEADVSDPAQVEGTIQQPSIRVLHDTKDIGISAGIRTPQGLLGAAPDLPARYGQAAKEAGETILLTETEIMRESGFRAERLQDALKKADKKDWGKNGDKFYDHITDPSRDGELQPSSLEAVQEVRRFLEEDRQEIIGIKREKLRKSVSTLEEKAYRQANDLVGKKLDEDQIAEVQALAEEALREKIPDDWGVENYLPQFHPGSWEILRDGVHVGTAHTPFDAKLAAIEDWASHPDLTPDSYTIQGRAFRGGDVVRVGRPRFRKIVSDIADAAEGAVSKDEVSQFLAGKIGTKEGKQKFAGFLQKRQGFEGFSKDLPRVLGMYNQQFVRWKYLSDMNAKIQPLIDKIKKEERPQTAEYVQGMMDYLWGPPPTKASLLLDNTIAKIPGVRDHVKPMLLDRSMGFIKRRTVDAFLKFSPRFHALNRVQRFQTTEPLVTLEESIAGRKFYASAEGKAKLKEFGIKFLTGGKTIEGIQPRLGTLPADVSWATTREKMRSLAPETSNQEIVWATFFKKGKMRGMSDVEASNYAILQGNVYSQFLALRSDTPLIMRGPMGSSVFQFKRFPIKDIELGIDQVQAKNMPGVAKWLGAKLLLGGAKALVDPKLVGGGYLAYETYQALKDEYGETVANGVMYGLPGLAGVDMSYSFQLAAQPNGDNFKEALGNALLPPWASTLEAAGAAYANDKGLEDNPLQRGVNSLVEKVPSLKFINAMRAWAVSLDKGEYEFRTSDGRLKFQADLKDVLLKAGGFRTVEEGVSQLAVDGFTEIAAERNEILDRTTMKLLQVLNGEGELNEELFSETMDWNENRPEVPIAADALMTRLRRRVPADKIPEIERKLKALGKNYYYWWKATEGN